MCSIAFRIIGFGRLVIDGMLQRKTPTQTRRLCLIACCTLWILSFGSLCGVPQDGPDSDLLDLTIEQAVSQALAVHPEITEAQLLLQVAELELDAEKATQLVPELDLKIVPPDVTPEGVSGSVEGTISGSLALPVATSGVLSGSIGFQWDPDADELRWETWMLTVSGKLDFLDLDAGTTQLQHKRDAVDDARQALVQVGNDVLIQTIDTYAALAAEQRLVAQAEADLAEARQSYDQAIADREAGWLSEHELLEARLRLFDAEIELDERTSKLAEQLSSFYRESLGLEMVDGSELVLTPIFDVIDWDLVVRAAEILAQEDKRLLEAIEVFASVIAAEQAVVEAEENLYEARYDVLPTVAVSARWNETGWQIGGEISVDLISPERHAAIEIAQIELDLAETRAEAVRSDAENTLFDQRDALAQALQDLDRLDIERERWALEAEIVELQRDAGLLSEGEWNDSLAEQTEFAESAQTRQIDVLIEILELLDVLGTDLQETWEEWLR